MRVIGWVGVLRIAIAFAVVFTPAADATAQCADPAPPPDPDNCISGWRCVRSTGEWVEVYATSGPCNDGNPCTVSDSCGLGGSCTGTPMVCQPRGPCDGTGQCVAGACTYTLLSPRPCPSSTNACEAVCDGSSPYCQPN